MEDKKYDVFSFDLWGTLLKGNKNHTAERNQLINTVLFPEVTPNYLSVEITKAKIFADYSNEVLGQQMTWEQSMLMIAYNLNNGLDKAVMAERFEQYSDKMGEILLNNLPRIYSSEVYEVLDNLKIANKTILFASNTSFTPGYLMKEVLKKLGLYDYASACVFSDEINASKPSHRFFHAVRRISNSLKLNEILHIGDNLYADGGSVKLGIDFLYVNGNSNVTLKKILNHI